MTTNTLTTGIPLVNKTLQAENEMERAILNDPLWIKGAFWGEPRRGHPEGKIIYHIAEVLENVDKICANHFSEYRAALRLITLLHDTFKYQEAEHRSLGWKKHHATFAYEFATKIIRDPKILNTIELHDEAYYVWCAKNYYLCTLTYQARLDRLLSRIQGIEQLYYMFFKCDTQTGDKTQEPVIWFENNIPNILKIEF